MYPGWALPGRAGAGGAVAAGALGYQGDLPLLSVGGWGHEPLHLNVVVSPFEFEGKAAVGLRLDLHGRHQWILRDIRGRGAEGLQPTIGTDGAGAVERVDFKKYGATVPFGAHVALVVRQSAIRCPALLGRLLGLGDHRVGHHNQRQQGEKQLDHGFLTMLNPARFPTKRGELQLHAIIASYLIKVK